MGTRASETHEQLTLFPEEGGSRTSPVQVGGTEVAGPVRADLASLPCVSLEERVAAVGSQALVRFTHNRSVLLSLRRTSSGQVLRAHACFRMAPEPVVDAVVRLYLTKTRRRERRALAHLVTQWHHESAPLPGSLLPDDVRKGSHHDLAQFLRRVQSTHFDRAHDLDVTFGKRISRRLLAHHERRSPRGLIVVNPALDHPWVSAWYLEYLIFHEILHEEFPPRAQAGRMLIHPPEFRRRERLHPDFERARPYEKWLLSVAWPELVRSHETRRITSRATQSTATTRAARRANFGSQGAGSGEP